jgi:hypothetical protein
MPPEKKRPRSKRGKVVNCTNPNWEPILHLARIYVDDFMWVCEIELKGGTRLQAYKHYWTRLSIHLDDEANAFTYRGDDLYRQVPEKELAELFDRVVRRPDPSLPSRRREWDDGWEGGEETADPGDAPALPF